MCFLQLQSLDKNYGLHFFSFYIAHSPTMLTDQNTFCLLHLSLSHPLCLCCLLLSPAFATLTMPFVKTQTDRGHVYRRSGFVHDEDAALPDEGSGQTEQLSLTLAEVFSSFRHYSIWNSKTKHFSVSLYAASYFKWNAGHYSDPTLWESKVNCPLSLG